MSNVGESLLNIARASRQLAGNASRLCDTADGRDDDSEFLHADGRFLHDTAPLPDLNFGAMNVTAQLQCAV